MCVVVVCVCVVVCVDVVYFALAIPLMEFLEGTGIRYINRYYFLEMYKPYINKNISGTSRNIFFP